MELLDLDSDSLVQILYFLNLKDLLAVSNTCTLLKGICLSTKSLWGTSFTVHLGQETEENERKIKLTEDDNEILELIGNRMLDMNISLDFFEVKDFDLRSLETQSCKNLKKFSFEAVNLDLPSITSNGAAIQKLPRNICARTLSVTEFLFKYLDGARSLEMLSLSAHSFTRLINRKYRIPMIDLFRCGDFDKSLKSLSLDCFFSTHRHYTIPSIWYDSQKLFYISESYYGFIGRFKNLQKLEINSLYLCDGLLQALAQPDRVSLQSMTVVLDFIKKPITAWPQLVNSSPSLKVTVEVDYDAWYQSIHDLLPECVPIVNFKIYAPPRRGLCKRNALRNILGLLSMYKQTLESVAVQNGSRRWPYSPDYLFEIVTQCPKLQTLYLQGQISFLTIQNLASMRQWLKLGVLEKDIFFQSRWDKNNEKCRSKSYMKKLCQQITEKLGRVWRPESEDALRAVFSRPIVQ